MVDYRGPPYQLPHRKPVPQSSHNAVVKPLTSIVPDSQIPASQKRIDSSTHSRSRTSSSSIFPQGASTMTFSPTHQTYSPTSYQTAPNQHNGTRRTLSNATTSTNGTSTGLTPARTNSTVSGSLRRSISSRSGSSPSGYVALMRKQKATVWCDRSQHEDPRFLAQQKAAKMRAVKEVVGAGGANAGRTSTSGSGSMLSHSVVRSKIRHHGAAKGMGYAPGNMLGGGVPMRLSASEVGDEDYDDDDWDSQHGTYLHRDGSGRSSIASYKRYTSSNLRTSTGRYSHGNTPPSGHGSSASDGMAELAETPVPNDHRRPGDYFTQKSGTGISGGSGSSGDRESSFGNVSQMAAPHGPSTHIARGKSMKSAEELRRRGSVDDRTATMSGVRLYVANPDLSD